MPHGDHEDGVAVAIEASKTELAPPPLYKIMILNDDYTPMDFVVDVLELYFGMSSEQATQIMMVIHTQGRAQCGIFTKDVAETKVSQVAQYAHECQHPLMCEIEMV